MKKTRSQSSRMKNEELISPKCILLWQVIGMKEKKRV